MLSVSQPQQSILQLGFGVRTYFALMRINRHGKILISEHHDEMAAEIVHVTLNSSLALLVGRWPAIVHTSWVVRQRSPRRWCSLTIGFVHHS